MTASARCKPYLYIRACTVHWNCSQETQSNFILRYLEVVLLIRTFEPEKCKRANLTAIAMSILKILSYGYNLATIKSQRNINNYDIRSQKAWFTTLSLRFKYSDGTVREHYQKNQSIVIPTSYDAFFVLQASTSSEQLQRISNHCCPIKVRKGIPRGLNR